MEGHRCQRNPQTCRFDFSSANLTTGVRFDFERVTAQGF